MNKVRLASFSGIDTRNDPSADVLQPPQRNERDARLYLPGLVGGFVTDDKRIAAFPSSESVATGTTWAASINTAFGLLVHDQGAGEIIWNPGPDQEVLVENLGNAPMVWIEHQGLIYWACDEDRGRITPTGVNLPWALPQAPTPDVTNITGTMPAGHYLVSVTWLDSTNAESGCAPSAEVTLAAPGALRIAVGSIPTGVSKVRVYVSPPNGQHPALVADVATDAFPYDVTVAHEQAGPKVLTPLRTQGLSPMPVGSGMTTRGGFLLTWTDTVLWFSVGAWSHLCDQSQNLIIFPDGIISAVGLDRGVWVITERGAYWVDGADLTQARLVPVTARRTYAAGGARISAADAFDVQSAQDVAVFASSEGPVVGTTDGQLVAPLAESQSWDVIGKVAQIALVEQNGTRLMAFNLVEVVQ